MNIQFTFTYTHTITRQNRRRVSRSRSLRVSGSHVLLAWLDACLPAWSIDWHGQEIKISHFACASNMCSFQAAKQAGRQQKCCDNIFVRNTKRILNILPNWRYLKHRDTTKQSH